MLKQLLSVVRLKLRNKISRDKPDKIKIIKFGKFYLLIVRSKFYTKSDSFRAWHLPNEDDYKHISDNKML